ncbi:hypothetical protein TWF506_000017 [Arthrobotrys conoides]|uniref:Uncharacterized protein n=1 Tax=Arthrobotrys conoides TaxID=74498 RepID=A0AAN8PQB4_9PEZI
MKHAKHYFHISNQTKRFCDPQPGPGVRSNRTNLQAGTAYCMKQVGSIRRYDDWKPAQFPSDISTATINPDEPPNNRTHTHLWPNSTVLETITVTQSFPPAAESRRWATYTVCPDFGATSPEFEDGGVPRYALENEVWMSVYDQYCMIGGNRTIPTATPMWPKLDVPLTAVPHEQWCSQRLLEIGNRWA